MPSANRLGNRLFVYPQCLLMGTLLIIVAALLHPHLAGGGAEELGRISQSHAWRQIHWAFLFGFVLSLTGLAGVVGRYAGTTGEDSVRVGVIVMTFAYAAWMVVVTFMLGAGWTLAQSHVAPDGGITPAQVVLIYDMMRPFALVAQRIAAFALGMATCALGWGLLQARLDARWLGWSGVGSGLFAIALAVIFGEATKADQAAFAPPVLWQFVVAGVLLARRWRPV